jgi:hypothetical protein
VPGQQVLARAGEKGLAVAKPVYAAQVAIYQAYLELHEHPAIFTAINADTMEIYTEPCPLTRAGPAHVGSGGEGHHRDRGRGTPAARLQ